MTLKPIRYPYHPPHHHGSHVEVAGIDESPDLASSASTVVPLRSSASPPAALSHSAPPALVDSPSPELLTPLSTPDKDNHQTAAPLRVESGQRSGVQASDGRKVLCSLVTVDNSRYLVPNKMAPCGSQEVYHNFDIRLNPPFSNPVDALPDCMYGVLKVKNIPYTVTIQEIKHFINRFAQGSLLTPHVHGFPVHIIIERSTGKTMDCYVEFMTHEDAAQCLIRIENTPDRYRHLKIGQRQIQVEMSSQGELLSDLFARAKCVQWDPATGKPRVVPNTDPHSEGFRGFFTVEEMASLVKHAQAPQRSPFTNRCMQRPYESMISTLYKFPWSTTHHYTIAARDYLFCTYNVLLELLVRKVHPEECNPSPFFPDFASGVDREVGLSHSLLMDFLFAGLNTPTFSMRQKFHIVANCGSAGHGFSLTGQAFSWPFLVLSPPYGTPDLVLEFWLKIMSDGFDMMNSRGLNHGMETYARVERDNYGAISFCFTTPGNNLQFKEGVVVEKRIMEQFIEKGRTKWCIDHGIAYHPVFDSKPFKTNSNKQVEGLMALLKLDRQPSKEPIPGTGSSQESNGAASGEEASNVHGINYSLPPSFSLPRQYDVVERAAQATTEAAWPASRQVSLTPAGQPFRTTTMPRIVDSRFVIDPTTPEFVPSGLRARSGSATESAISPDSFRVNPASFTPHGLHDVFAASQLPYGQSATDITGVGANAPVSDSAMVIDRTVSTLPNGSSSPLSTGSRQSPNEQVRNCSRLEHLANNAVDTYFGSAEMHSTPGRTVTRRRTINIDTTIHEEAEDGHFHHHDGIARSAFGADNN